MKKIIIGETPQQRVKRKLQISDDDLFQLTLDIGNTYINRQKWPTDVAKKMRTDRRFWQWLNAIIQVANIKLDKLTEPAPTIYTSNYYDYHTRNLSRYQVNEAILKTVTADYDAFLARALEAADKDQTLTGYPKKNLLSDIYHLISKFNTAIGFPIEVGLAHTHDDIAHDVQLLLCTVTDSNWKPYTTNEQFLTLCTLCITYLCYHREEADVVEQADIDYIQTLRNEVEAQIYKLRHGNDGDTLTII